MREETYIKYYADDESVFYNKEECIEYENNCNMQLDKVFPDLYVMALEDTEPLSFSFRTHNTIFIRDSFIKYQWFLLKSSKDYNDIINILPEYNKLKSKLKEPSTYPNLLAVELTMPYKKIINEKWRYSGCYAYISDEEKKTKKYFEKIHEILNIQDSSDN